MKIEMELKTIAAGPNGVFEPGSKRLVDEEFAAQLVQSGIASPVDKSLLPKLMAYGKKAKAEDKQSSQQKTDDKKSA